MTGPDRPTPHAAAVTVLSSRYPDAVAAFLAGSVVRGEATVHSDLDLVVVMQHCDGAYRESFHDAGWPIEAFVHDPETLAYFFWEIDRASGVPSLATMVEEGTELLGVSPVSARVKAAARAVLAAGPPLLTTEQQQERRYAITDLVDDLRQPRTRDEAEAAGARLYDALADYAFRARGHWSAKGKSIPRQLARFDADLAARFTAAFGALFRDGRADAVVALAESELRPHGGLFFAGYRREAPSTWRRAADALAG